MHEWEMAQINDLISSDEADLQTGPFGTQLKASEYVEAGVPVINVRNIGYGTVIDAKLEYITEKTADRLKVHRLVEGDIVFGRKGAVERHALIDKKTQGWIQGSDCLRLRIKSDRVSTKFLSHYFNTAAHKLWMEAQCSFGATMSSLNQDIVKRISYPNLPPATQKKIAAILSAYDELIENNRRRIALLERMAEEIYREWFVRLRFPGYEHVKVHKGVPEGWETKKIRELVTHYIGGGWGNDTSTADHRVGAFVIRGTDIPGINAGNYSQEIFRYHQPSNYATRRLVSGDIIFEASGGSKDQLLGRTLLITDGVLSYFENNAICASFCKLIRFKNESVSPYFMKYFFQLYYETGLVGTFQVQSTGISNYQFETFLSVQSISIPSRNLMQKFNMVVGPILQNKDRLALTNVYLEKTRDLLLSRLIAGKLAVDDLDIHFPPGMAAEP